ncbi:MAG TPA: hypothetical protein VHD62_14425 [Opitutaceae bacterium]|nr:hypothetical protein [Opitutaceae bacterium]
MNAVDPIILQELPAIRKIIQDEIWLEGERRGCPVSPADAKVRQRVCEIVLNVGQQLREAVERRALAERERVLAAGENVFGGGI